ncbi:phosphoribosyltransferase family protein [soil metagenome]
MMHYRSVADLNDQVVKWTAQLPRDLDVIAGVPRSGLLVANLLALHLNLPLTDVEGLLQGKVFEGGARLRRRGGSNPLGGPKKVLIVDDSVHSGKQMHAVRERLAAAALPHDVSYAAAYVKPGAEELVDFFADVVPLPRCFEWNLMHSRELLSMSCMDIDGVLCRDPNHDENDDGENYLRFLECTAPLYLPTETVGWFVTCRLEKYRGHTEAWLARHGVRCEELLMMGYPDQASRQAANAYATYKAEIYRRTGARLFIESSPEQALEIAMLSRKPVFCMDTRAMLYPDRLPANPLGVRKVIGKINTARVKGRRKLRHWLRHPSANLKSLLGR